MTQADPIRDADRTMAGRIARAATAFQRERTGREPGSVGVVLGGDTLVVTFHDALSPAERAMSATPGGAAKVQEFHRRLFQSASDSLRDDIGRITGMDVREASTEVEAGSGAVVQVFATGTMVQVFLLSGKVPPGSFEAPAYGAKGDVPGGSEPPPEGVPADPAGRGDG